MDRLKNGFYTALGTPLDKDGNLVEESLKNISISKSMQVLRDFS